MNIINKLYMVKWPDGSCSVLDALDIVDLYDKLDREGDPNCANVFEIKFEEESGFHLTFNVGKRLNETSTFINADVESDYYKPAKLKKLTFPKDIFEKYTASITRMPLKKVKALSNINEIKNMLGNS